jgi:hypothetical protein
MTLILRRLRLPVLVLVLALGACGEEGRLADALGKDYGPAVVTFATPDSTHLQVVFFDSPFADRPEPERAGTARKVAEYVRDHYPRYKALDKVTVAFMTRKEGEAGGKQAAARHTFSRAELGP